MATNSQRIRNRKKELVYEFIIRWWGAGAVYFFIGWGTGLGMQQTPFDFIFVLGLASGILTIAVLDVIIFNVLDIERNDGELYNKKYHERTIIQNVLIRSGEIIKALLIVVLVFVLYNVINVAIITITNGNPDLVPLPGEPILYGLFYTGFYYLFRVIIRLVKGFFTKKV